MGRDDRECPRVNTRGWMNSPTTRPWRVVRALFPRRARARGLVRRGWDPEVAGPVGEGVLNARSGWLHATETPPVALANDVARRVVHSSGTCARSPWRGTKMPCGAVKSKRSRGRRCGFGSASDWNAPVISTEASSPASAHDASSRPVARARCPNRAERRTSEGPSRRLKVSARRARSSVMVVASSGEVPARERIASASTDAMSTRVDVKASGDSSGAPPDSRHIRSSSSASAGAWPAATSARFSAHGPPR